MNAYNLLKNQSKRVIEFFFTQLKDESTEASKETQSQSQLEELNNMRKSMEDRDRFFKEQEQLILDNEEIYVNELCCEGEMPNLNNLFRFIVDDGTDNITAVHYFTEIVISLLQERPEQFLSYVYSRKEVLEFLIDNIGIRSIKNLAVKVLNLNKDDNKASMNFKFFRHRFSLFTKLIRKMHHLEGLALENTAEVFIDLIKEEENVVDAEYFIEKLLIDKDSFKSLISSIRTKRSSKLLELISLVIKKVFFEKENESEQFESKNPTDRRSKTDSDEGYTQQLGLNMTQKLPAEFRNKTYEYEEEEDEENNKPEFLDIEDDLNIQVQIKETTEDDSDFKKVEEDTEESIEVKNLEFEMYDSNNMKRLDLVSIIEAELPHIMLVLSDTNKDIVLQQDGEPFSLKSKFKLGVLRFLKIITKLDYNTIKDILLERTAINLVIVSLSGSV